MQDVFTILNKRQVDFRCIYALKLVVQKLSLSNKHMVPGPIVSHRTCDFSLKKQWICCNLSGKHPSTLLSFCNKQLICCSLSEM